MDKRLKRRTLFPLVRILPEARSFFRLPARRLRLVDEYALAPDFYPTEVRARIYLDEEEGKLIYHVEEPPLNEMDKLLYQEVLGLLYYEPPINPEEEDFEKEIVRTIARLVKKYHVLYPGSSIPAVMYYVIRDTVGASWIDPLLRDPYIEDISCNGANVPIYVWHQRHEYLKTTLALPEEELDMLVLKLAYMGRRHISIANPIVDAILPGGHRLAATYRKEVTTGGSTFTIRKFREEPITITELINYRTIDTLIAAYAWEMMEWKRNGLILGVTGSGKTTLLNAIATLINPSYKVVTIEDTPELRLPLENWVQLVSREYGIKGGSGEQVASEVTLFDLVKVSLRYRPEIIIVGEVRGEEAYVLFQAMATGHGGLSTLHAESIYSAVERLTSPPMNIPKAYMNLIHFSFLIRRVELEGRIQRRVAFAWEVQKYGDYREVFRWRYSTDDFEHRLEESITLKNIAENFLDTTVDEMVRRVAKKALVFYYMWRKKIFSFDEIATLFSKYYGNKEYIMRIVEDYVSGIRERDHELEKIHSILRQ